MSKSTRIAKKSLAAAGLPLTKDQIEAVKANRKIAEAITSDLPIFKDKEARIEAKAAEVAAATAKKPSKKAPVEPTAPAASTTPASTKVRTSATEEKYDAAVNGTIVPRGPQPATAEGSRKLGLTTGLPIQLCWLYTFQENEKRADAHKKDAKTPLPWTDEKIQEFINSEFPDRPARTFSVHSARQFANRGNATRNRPLKRQSRRYDEAGKVVEGRMPRATATVAPSAQSSTPELAHAAA